MNHLKIWCNWSPNQCEVSPIETYGIDTSKVNIFCMNAFKQKHDIRQMRWTLVTFVTHRFLLSKQFPGWIPVVYSLNETKTYRDITKASALWLERVSNWKRSWATTTWVFLIPFVLDEFYYLFLDVKVLSTATMSTFGPVRSGQIFARFQLGKHHADTENELSGAISMYRCVELLHCTRR